MSKSNYELVKEIVLSCEDERIESRFNDEFEVGEDVSEEKYFMFFNNFIDDGSEYYDVKKNWDYIISGGDNSVYDED